MTDYISREEAFNAILKLVPKVDDDGYCWVIRGDAAMAIDSLLDADVRPVVYGFWVEESGEDAHTGEYWCVWKCSECGNRRTAGWQYTQEGRKPRDNFCPNCGAKMRKTDDKTIVR